MSVMKKFVLLFILVIVALPVYLLLKPNKAQETQITNPQVETVKDKAATESGNKGIVKKNGDGTQKYTLDEVANHSTEDDCWIVIHNKVYDVTKFIPTHPGGRTILEGCGTDATELFETRPMGSGTPHSERARTLSQNFLIGEIE